MPPAIGTAPPVRPVPPARGVIGTSASRATASAARMSSLDVASTTASGTSPLGLGLVAHEALTGVLSGQNFRRAKPLLEQGFGLVARGL